MIVDTLENAAKYRGLNPDIDRALEKAREYRAENFPEEPLILDDFAKLLCARYTTGKAGEGKFEAHRKFIDVMVMVDGEETIYVKPVSQLEKVTQPYDEAGDALLSADEAGADVTAVHMAPGTFCILFPQDAHMPGRISKEAMPIRKFIGKVRIREK